MLFLWVYFEEILNPLPPPHLEKNPGYTMVDFPFVQKFSAKFYQNTKIRIRLKSSSDQIF